MRAYSSGFWFFNFFSLHDVIFWRRWIFFIQFVQDHIRWLPSSMVCYSDEFLSLKFYVGRIGSLIGARRTAFNLDFEVLETKQYWHQKLKVQFPGECSLWWSTESFCTKKGAEDFLKSMPPHQSFPFSFVAVVDDADSTRPFFHRLFEDSSTSKNSRRH